MLKINNSVLNINGSWLNTNVSPEPPDVYRVYTSAQYGTITANPSSGLSGTEVTLSNSPHPNYQFNSYSITGSTLKSPNTFDILSEDVYVVGNFDRIYNVILQQTEGGRITATPTKGINGTVITLSNSPTSTNYSFNGYTVTGATLYSGNKFNINGSDVTVRANWKYEPIPASDQVKIGNQTWMNKNLAIDDGNGGIIKQDNVIVNGVNFGTQYYYTRAAAIRLANSISGWHLPSYSEMQTLTNSYGSNQAKAIRSTSGWSAIQGTNSTGFNAIPVGYYSTSFDQRGTYASFINSTYILLVSQNGTNYNNGNYYYSVRLIKDS